VDELSFATVNRYRKACYPYGIVQTQMHRKKNARTDTRLDHKTCPSWNCHALYNILTSGLDILREKPIPKSETTELFTKGHMHAMASPQMNAEHIIEHHS
jgi:hypothetical protein